MPDKNFLTTSPIQAQAISPGIAIGPAQIYKPLAKIASVDRVDTAHVEIERERLHAALTTALDELRQLSEHVEQTVGRNEADIFAAQQLMLEDPDLLEEIQRLIIEEHFSAASALQQATENLARELEGLDNETLSARAADLRDVAARVIHLLQDANTRDGIRHNGRPIVIVAHDLTPSDTATLDSKMILGICTVVGGPTTHAAIIARALEIPAIAGIDPQVLQSLQDGQQIAIDGTQGLLYLESTEEQQEELKA